MEDDLCWFAFGVMSFFGVRGLPSQVLDKIDIRKPANWLCLVLIALFGVSLASGTWGLLDSSYLLRYVGLIQCALYLYGEGVNRGTRGY